MSSSSLSQAAKEFFTTLSQCSLNAVTIIASVLFMGQYKHTGNAHQVLLIDFHLPNFYYFS